MPQRTKRRLTVSVIIPTYNRAALLVAAVESALNQTRAPEEILVVDDGSTDNTLHVMQAYAPRVRVIKQPNQGVSAARNHGMREASGDVFIYLDSDDLLTPRCVELCAGALEDNPSAAVVYADCYLVDGDGQHLGLYSQVERCERPSGMIFDHLARRCIVNMSSGTVRRSALHGSEFDITLGPAADYDFWRQLAARHPFVYVAEPTACYRYHGAQMITEQRLDILDEAIEVQRRIIAMPEFNQLSPPLASGRLLHARRQACHARQQLPGAVGTSSRPRAGLHTTPWALPCCC